MKSSFGWAIFLFIIINTFLNRENELKFIAATTSRAHLFDYSGAENSVNYLSFAPNVVLLGSSLLIQPEWSIDRNLALKEPWGKATIISSSNYHLAQGMEDELSRTGFDDPHVYNLAVCGALISDSYLLLHHYIKNHPKPSVIVLDCAPRSFNDSGVNQPNSTPIFDHCFQVQDLSELQKLYLPKFDDKVNFLCSRLFFTYHHRQWLAAGLKDQLAGVFASNGQCESRPTAPVCTSANSTKLAETKLAGSMQAKIKRAEFKQTSSEQTSPEQMQLANTESPVPAVMTKSLQEYKDRYQYANRSSLAPQLNFLKLISQRCASEHIKLVVVNMPLSSANRQLLSDHFYSDFTNDVSAAVGSGAHFVNLASASDWPISHFHDSVHLNAKGGARLNRLIADAIVNPLPENLVSNEQEEIR